MTPFTSELRPLSRAPSFPCTACLPPHCCGPRPAAFAARREEQTAQPRSCQEPSLRNARSMCHALFAWHTIHQN
ncbi:hypothetical protein SKAU_G00105900 [Synaphobranchus kaupii]|uniref:Uncharacterized protein n=1 Tax=Synaphobranchus kaupii TaxID=118154 RepID=A0A9Q1J6U5_SYNKA|nr:hypothetical protein SKAU_G00105900 [Synaphobranchus kaupii]